MIQSKLASKIEESFESFDNFVQQFTTASLGVFGSGWTWLVEKDNTLAIMGLPNAENPLTYNQHALMGIDVWEHAYYLDYKNLRGDYVKAILENLINWDFVENRLS
jgi:Fe-Mn family superoxide dismutase